MQKKADATSNIETSIHISDGDDDRKSSAAESKVPLAVELLPVSKLRPAKRNARTHSKKQIREIANSILRFGMINPVVVDEQQRIVAGHARADAAKLLGLRTIPAIRVTHLSEEELRAYALADNKLASKAGWDRELLAIELQELQVSLPVIELDIGITGFEPGEIDAIVSDFSDAQNNPADVVPEINHENIIARRGDLFVLGKHRLLVGDARDDGDYTRLMQGAKAEMAFLDPPYNVKVDGHIGGRGKVKHREFAFASGEMTSEQFVSFLKESLGACSRHTIDGGIVYVCMDWRHASELLRAGAAAFDELKNICVWVKSNAGQGAFYRSAHELVFVYKRGKAPHLNTFELGQHGRSRTNVWNYAGMNTFRAGRMDELKIHPTVKPVALIADAMRDCSRRGAVVLDAFAGSGSTIIAAEQIGRRAFCIEIDAIYVDAAIRRWQKLSGKDAILESTGQTFEEMSSERSPALVDNTAARKK